jgi:3-hydroxyisobutyrate dehydrogenase-like beta-hydroxyacid dehydrogenase
MLADDAGTRAVLIDDGVLNAMAPRSTHVNMATVSVATARAMAAVHLARGALGRPDSLDLAG